MSKVDYTNGKYIKPDGLAKFLEEHADGASREEKTNVISRAKKFKRQKKYVSIEVADTWVCKIERHLCELPDDIWVIINDNK